MSIKIDFLSGSAPIQAEGTFFGVPFYFRARGKHWYVTTAKDMDSKNVFDGLECRGGFFMEQKYGTSEFDASSMPLDEALHFIADAYKAFKAARDLQDIDND